MSNQVLSIAGWYFLPNLVTNWLQSFYYRSTIRAGDPWPQQHEQRFQKHRRVIFTLVIIAYLLYTVYEVDWDLLKKGDFYSDLGVPVDVDEKKLQSRFRRLTVQYHPDKLNNPSPEQLANVQTYYVHLKTARDTLLDSSKRFAYERFGPDILEWKDCITKLDFVKKGLYVILPYYVISLGALLVIGLFGYSEYGKYWQYFAIAAVFLFELHTVTRPEFPAIISKVASPVMAFVAKRPAYLPFQAIAIARRIAVSAFIAVAQLSPQYRRASASDDSDKARQEQLKYLMASAADADNATQRMLQLETVPFMGDFNLESRLKACLTAWLVQNEVRNDAGVQRAISKALERRNAGEADEQPDEIIS